MHRRGWACYGSVACSLVSYYSERDRGEPTCPDASFMQDSASNAGCHREPGGCQHAEEGNLYTGFGGGVAYLPQGYEPSYQCN